MLMTAAELLCKPLMMDLRYIPSLMNESVRAINQMAEEGRPEEPKLNSYLVSPEGESMSLSDGLPSEKRAPGSMIAVVPLQGILTRHGYSSWFSANIGTLEIGRHLKALDADEAVGTIVLNVNTPGGTVAGTPELAQILYGIREAGKTKTIAVVDPLMASAGTYIATAAEKVFAIPSADVGSVGVINSYSDYSKFLEERGISIEYFRHPEKKARFTSVEPMDDSMRERMMEGIMEAYGLFVADMARNRGVSEKHVEEHFGKGDTMSAKEGVDVKMIDGIRSLDDVIVELVTENQSKQRATMRRMAEERMKSVQALDGVDASADEVEASEEATEEVAQA